MKYCMYQTVPCTLVDGFVLTTDPNTFLRGVLILHATLSTTQTGAMMKYCMYQTVPCILVDSFVLTKQTRIPSCVLSSIVHATF
jgi:hypothetical protein